MGLLILIGLYFTAAVLYVFVGLATAGFVRGYFWSGCSWWSWDENEGLFAAAAGILWPLFWPAYLIGYRILFKLLILGWIPMWGWTLEQFTKLGEKMGKDD